jgi:hypothetical protein
VKALLQVALRAPAAAERAAALRVLGSLTGLPYSRLHTHRSSVRAPPSPPSLRARSALGSSEGWHVMRMNVLYLPSGVGLRLND